MTHREFSSKGGKARSKKLSPQRRREIASLGGKARGKGRPKAVLAPEGPKRKSAS
jgi:hypothetical protein